MVSNANHCSREWCFPQVLHEYNLLAGRVWSLFIIWLVVAPWLFFRIRQARFERTDA
jgi:hypothetical protein